jgi:outer membrane protein assembly factor BamA
MQPFTLAFRGLHYGRYGKDADGISEERNQRILNDLFVGYEHLIRGYDYNSFSGAECRASPTQPGGCPVIDRLFGTRMAVASMELRLPLLGFPQAGLGLINFPFLPTEIAPFVDMGLAWSDGNDPVLAFKTNTFERVPVFSAGMTARMNLFGYFVLEAYYAYPFQRPDKGGHFGFQLMPGW